MAGIECHARENTESAGVLTVAATSPEVRVVSHLRSGLSVRLAEGNGRTHAAVRGEVDLDCADMLEHALTDALRSSADGLDVDFSAVRFFDCAGLNALLRVYAEALDSGADLALTAMSPAVERVMDLTGTREMLAAAIVRDRAASSPTDAPTALRGRPA